MQMTNGRFLPAASSEEEQHSHRPSAHLRGGCGGFDATEGEEVARSDEEGGSGDNENGESEERRATTSSTVAAAVEFARGYLGFAWLDVETREVRNCSFLFRPRRRFRLFLLFSRQSGG